MYAATFKAKLAYHARLAKDQRKPAGEKLTAGRSSCPDIDLAGCCISCHGVGCDLLSSRRVDILATDTASAGRCCRRPFTTKLPRATFGCGTCVARDDSLVARRCHCNVPSNKFVSTRCHFRFAMQGDKNRKSGTTRISAVQLSCQQFCAVSVGRTCTASGTGLPTAATDKMVGMCRTLQAAQQNHYIAFKPAGLSARSAR
jgi:hypothetical protein